MNYSRVAIRSLIIGFYLLIIQSIRAETNIGLIQDESSAFEGYTLFAPISYTTTYLVNNDGNLVHSWPSSYQPGNVVYLLEDGRLLRTGIIGNTIFTSGGSGGKIQKIAWDGSLEWDYTYSSTEHLQHHDVEILPNGNILMIAWEYKSKAAAILTGRDPALINAGKLWPDTVIEVEPSGLTGGNIVWEWHLWDHLIQDYDPARNFYGVVADNPQLVDINHTGRPGSGPADWTHINAIDYNEELDQILLSVHNFDEIWVIDHSTTTTESASHSGGNSSRGGDILYRWGNPQTYGRGDASDQKFFGQHDAQWIENGLPGEGNILVFNNGDTRPGNYSSVEEIDPPVDESGTYYLAPGASFGPETQTWIYTADNPSDFYSSHISGAHRMEDGHTMICEGETGRLFEIDADEEIVWQYVNPVDLQGPHRQGTDDLNNNQVFRCYRYGPDYPGLAGKDLTPAGPIELPEPRSLISGGDYNGDGTCDPAIFRPATGLWAVRGITRDYFGAEGDVPACGDYRGDGIARIGIFRPGSGLWAIRGLTRIYFGRPDDTSVPGDYNGDGTYDLGIFRDISGLWALRGITRAYFGELGDSPVPEDFDGDSTTDIAIFRDDNGLWAIRELSRVYFGTGGDNPVAGDYDRDGTADPAIFRPNSGLWALRGLTRAYFGQATDWVAPADYDGDAVDDIGVFRSSSGMWAIRGTTRIYYGEEDDHPVTR
jgi:arylsulfotransferase ASST